MLGSKGYVDLGSLDNLDNIAETEFTVMQWIKLDGPASSSNRVIVARTPADRVSAGWRLEIADRRVTFCLNRQTDDSCVTGGSEVAAAGPIPASKWVHVAAVRNHGMLALYIDGRLEHSANVGNAEPAGRHGELLLGSPAPADGQMLVDELQLYGRALSAKEIETKYRAEAAGSCSP